MVRVAEVRGEDVGDATSLGRGVLRRATPADARTAADKSSKRRVFASQDAGRRASDASAASRRNDAIVGGPRRASSESKGFDSESFESEGFDSESFDEWFDEWFDEATRLAGAPSPPPLTPPPLTPPLTAPTRSARSAAERAADARAASALSASSAAPTSRPPEPDPYPCDPRPDGSPEPPRDSAGVAGAEFPAPSRVRVVRIAAGRRPPAAVAARCSAATPRRRRRIASIVKPSRRSRIPRAMSRLVLASTRRINGSALSGHRDWYAEKSARAPLEHPAIRRRPWRSSRPRRWRRRFRAPPRVSHSRITRRSHPVA